MKGKPTTAQRGTARPGTAQRGTAQRGTARPAKGQRSAPRGRSFGPDTTGPKVRTGLLWFFLALAAVTGGRWWTAALWAAVAFLAAAQTVLAWGRADADAEDDGLAPSIAASAAVAGSAAAGITVASAYSTGLAGVALTAVALTAAAALVAGGPRRRASAPVAIGMVLASVAASSVVLAVRVDLWAGLFLVLAVSLYDAGAFLFGAESTSRWEGPAGGVIGVLAVTFTISTVQVAPFERAGAWIAGIAVAVGCVVGQWVVGALLPDPAASVPGLRRLDAYVVAGPAFVACAWLLGT